MYDLLPQISRVWDVASPDPAGVQRLVDELGVSERLGRLLVGRGIDAPEQAAAFLEPGEAALHPYSLLKGIPAAVEAILGAIARREKITIYGDYDCDGLTGSSILYWVIKKLKGSCDVFVPHRNREGYGLSVEALRRLAAQGTKLVITIDNGTSSVTEIAEARAMGMAVVICDHHVTPPKLPDATAMINPMQSDCAYPFKSLASVGLTQKLGAALLAASGLPDPDALVERFRQATIDLVAVGTIGDMVPLVGENRSLVRMGLAKLARTDHHGLRQILEQDGVRDPAAVTSEWVAFKLVPRLNAASRIADPAEALSLLLSRNEAEAASLARNLTALNQRRMKLVDQLWWLALDSRERWKNLAIPVAVLSTTYKGVMGLVASRMKETLGRPSIALASDGSSASGSGRSVDGFHLTHALEAVSGHVVRYGGHEQASGLTVTVDRMDAFIAALQVVAGERLKPEMLVPRIAVAAQVDVEDLAGDLCTDLARLAPFGVGNPKPLFLLRKLPVQDAQRVGRDGRHVKLISRKFPNGVDNIGFGLYQQAKTALERHAHLDVVVSVAKEQYQGRDRISLKIEDLRPHEG